MERDLLKRSADPSLFATYNEVQSGPLNGVSLFRRMQSLLRISLGIMQSLWLTRRYHPQALLITGGWATFPIAVACRLLNVPIAMFVPDIEPGMALKLIGRLAHTVYATTPDTQAFFPTKKVIVTGYPLRRQVLTADRPAAIAHFKLDPALKTLLIFGGSRGARSINQAIDGILPALLEDGIQILHITGQTDWPTVNARWEALEQPQKARYHAFPYLHNDMGLALAAADLAVSRAGASVLGELTAFGLPAVLIPYPFAWRYQKINAEWLAERGAAIRLNDELLSTELLPLICALLQSPERLTSMHDASLKLAVPDGAYRAADQLLALAAQRS